MIVESTLKSSIAIELKRHEFIWIRDYLYKQAGIVLNDSKMALVSGRLEKRLRHYALSSYSEYFRLLGQPAFAQETQLAIDLLTTNETYFFREPQHFDFIQQVFLPQQGAKPLRFWSAACSSGEEVYTLAMILAEHAQAASWEILGTDISSRILEKASKGLYPLAAAEKVPLTLLKKYCLKGSDEYAGYFLLDTAVRKHVRFMHLNLIDKLPDLGQFDVIFLRNVMIYFDLKTKQEVVQRLAHHLRPGGYLIISHSESLSGVKTSLKMAAPSIYQLPSSQPAS